MSSRSILLDPPKVLPTKLPPNTYTKVIADCPNSPDSHSFNKSGGIDPPRGDGADDQTVYSIIPLLSPEHRHIIETMVRELARLEGIEVPTGSQETNPEPLGLPP